MEKKNKDKWKVETTEDVGISPIIDEKTQLAIRIPASLVNEFQINSKKDVFSWTIKRNLLGKGKSEISLYGRLVKEDLKE